MLINTVSGIGPKIALNILSGINVAAFRGAVANGDVKALSQISGVGKKTAERIVVELREKMGAAGAGRPPARSVVLAPEDQKVNDAVLALMALGFKQNGGLRFRPGAVALLGAAGHGGRPGARVPEKGHEPGERLFKTCSHAQTGRRRVPNDRMVQAAISE